MTCTRCDNTGFLNIHQVDEAVRAAFDADRDHTVVLTWMEENEDHDVQVCDCCGDCAEWYGTPGEHRDSDFGSGGPYAYNGGLPECY